MRVVVPTAFTAASAAGEAEAARRFADAELVIVHVVDPRLIQRLEETTGFAARELHPKMHDYADVRLEEIVQRLVSEGRRARAELREGDPIDETLALGGDLIVIGVESGKAVGRFRTGIARKARVPLLLVPFVEPQGTRS